MENKERDTKEILSESFKEQLLRHPFEKITIKMITNGAGVIRPTFYNYFQDKNEVFEYILKEELMDVLYALLENGMEKEVIKMIFTYFGKNKPFYKKAFKVEGQNSFEDILYNEIFLLFMRFLEEHKVKINENIEILSTENIAKYHAVGIVYILKIWVLYKDFKNVTSDEIYDAYIFLISHSLLDIIE